MRDAAGGALGQQHIDDLLRGPVAEQLPLVLFMEGDAVALHQFDEVLRGKARQGRAAEIRVVPDEVTLRATDQSPSAVIGMKVVKW